MRLYMYFSQLQTATHDAYRLRMAARRAARRALEWIGMFEGLAVFLDMKLSDLFLQ